MISARQVWHDGLYTSVNSTMDSVIEQILSGIITNPGSGINVNRKKTKLGKNDNGSYRDELSKLNIRYWLGGSKKPAKLAVMLVQDSGD